MDRCVDWEVDKNIKVCLLVRASTVKKSCEYNGSSYACNALGIEAKLRTYHDLYLALGRTKSGVLENYRELF